MGTCWRFWRNHSLTIVITVISFAFLGLALYPVWPLEPDRYFDLWIGIFHGGLTIALFNALSGPLREKNKPDE